MQMQLRCYDRWQIHYRIPTPALTATYGTDSIATVSLENRTGAGVIRYEIK